MIRLAQCLREQLDELVQVRELLQRMRMRQSLTVIMTTSPIPSNPCTAMLEAVAESLSLVPGLEDCPKIVVCDGVKVKNKKPKASDYRKGCVDVGGQSDYELFIENVQRLAEQQAGILAGSTVLALKERQGFGFAVKAALEAVTTPWVMVVQHDHKFVRAVDLPGILHCMKQNPEVKYVGLLSGTTTKYQLFTESKYSIRITESIKSGLPLLPLLYWYDKTHVCTTAYYRDFVFKERYDSAESANEKTSAGSATSSGNNGDSGGSSSSSSSSSGFTWGDSINEVSQLERRRRGRLVVQRGDFIEDALGKKMLHEIRRWGIRRRSI
jgi:hypothetical protein